MVFAAAASGVGCFVAERLKRIEAEHCAFAWRQLALLSCVQRRAVSAHEPCDIRAVADHIHDLAGRNGEVLFTRPDPAVTVANMLLNLNISTKRKGFRYLEEAIAMYEKEPGQSVTKVLYPSVAKQVGGSKDSVERAIRAAIHVAWGRRDEKIWRLYFTPARDGAVPRPTNTAFIATLVECLKRQCRDQMHA